MKEHGYTASTQNSAAACRDPCMSDGQKLGRGIRKGSLCTCPTTYSFYLSLFRGDRDSVKPNTAGSIVLERNENFTTGLFLQHILYALENCQKKNMWEWKIWIQLLCKCNSFSVNATGTCKEKALLAHASTYSNLPVVFCLILCPSKYILRFLKQYGGLVLSVASSTFQSISKLLQKAVFHTFWMVVKCMRETETLLCLIWRALFCSFPPQIASRKSV